MFADYYKQNRYELCWSELSGEWTPLTPLRTDHGRRQALLEIDVLMALGFSLSLEQLIKIYNRHFPTFAGYERRDEYDSEGKRLPSSWRGDINHKEFVALRAHIDTEILVESLDPTGKRIPKRYIPPFSKVDREADYARAYEFFKKRYR